MQAHPGRASSRRMKLWPVVVVVVVVVVVRASFSWMKLCRSVVQSLIFLNEALAGRCGWVYVLFLLVGILAPFCGVLLWLYHIHMPEHVLNRNDHTCTVRMAVRLLSE